MKTNENSTLSAPERRSLHCGLWRECTAVREQHREAKDFGLSQNGAVGHLGDDADGVIKDT